MKFSLRNLLLTIALTATTALWGAVPAGYYRSLDGKTGADLKTAICELCYNHTQLDYYGLSSSFQKTDLYPDGSKRWWDMYSDIPLYAPSFNGLNREHSFPKSWWGGGTNTPAYTDINHLYPAEADANMKKSNWPLGQVYVTASTYDNGVSKVGSPISGQGGGATKVFEPANEYKGDFARTYFYMVSTYQNLTWASSYKWMLQQNTYPTLAPWAVKMLMEWAKNDPVSQKELDRNEAVYKLQNNRNPFIDFPTLPDYIWGDKVGQPFYTSGDPDDGNPILITPTQGMALDFGQVALGSEITAKLQFKGINLRGELELTISRGNKAMFELSDTEINADYANRNDGYWTTITYKPTALGQHSSKLFVTDGGISGSRGIDLIGECLPMPTLSAPVAEAPTDVTATTYVARWSVPADEVVDYWVVTRTRYGNGTSSSEELLAEENSLLIEDVEGPESYSVQSVRLQQRSEPSNVIYVEPAGVSTLYAASPLGTVNEPGGVRFRCGEPIAGVTVYDASGREVKTLDLVRDDDFLPLAPGCYIISAPRQRAPFRIVVH